MTAAIGAAVDSVMDPELRRPLPGERGALTERLRGGPARQPARRFVDADAEIGFDRSAVPPITRPSWRATCIS